MVDDKIQSTDAGRPQQPPPSYQVNSHVEPFTQTYEANVNEELRGFPDPESHSTALHPFDGIDDTAQRYKRKHRMVLLVAIAALALTLPLIIALPIVAILGIDKQNNALASTYSAGPPTVTVTTTEQAVGALATGFVSSVPGTFESNFESKTTLLVTASTSIMPASKSSQEAVTSTTLEVVTISSGGQSNSGPLSTVLTAISSSSTVAFPSTDSASLLGSVPLNMISALKTPQPFSTTTWTRSSRSLG